METLFDPTRKTWLFLDKERTCASSDIIDEKGQKIGITHRVSIGLGEKIELKETNETTVCEVHQKIVAMRQFYDIKDDTGKIIGRIKKHTNLTTKSKFILESDDHKELFEAKGSLFLRDFRIMDVSGKEVAQVLRVDKWKDQFVKKTDFIGHKYSLHINDAFVGKVDARQLVGLVVAIEDISRE